MPGPLLGYRASMGRAHDPKYKAYKEAIGYYAMGAGFTRLPVALYDTSKYRPRLSVIVVWRKAARIDWTNVVKAIEDALWPQDRNVDPGAFAVCRNRGKEYANVEIEWIRQ